MTEAMQHHAVLESSHFRTGSNVLILLTANDVIPLTGFGGNESALPTVHTYIGNMALCLLFLHAILGLKLGLAM